MQARKIEKSMNSSCAVVKAFAIVRMNRITQAVRLYFRRVVRSRIAFDTFFYPAAVIIFDRSRLCNT